MDAAFDDGFRAQFAQLLQWRRDVRHFCPDPVPETLIDELIALACLAPSVGFAQPWRFIKVDCPLRRADVIAEYERCNAEAERLYAGEKAQLYRSLKLSGLQQAPVHLAVCTAAGTAHGAGLGRQTQPQTLAHSVVCAIHTLWLAARAHGLGLGWVSIIRPEAVLRILDVPQDWELVAYLNLGWPMQDSARPELEQKGWERRLGGDEVVIRR